MSFMRSTDGTNLFYRDWGTGPAIVFAASLGVSGEIWNYNLPYFAERGYRVIALDRRGHGRSDDLGKGYDLDTLAGDIGALIDQLDLRDVTLVGHSLGGAEVLRCAGRAASAKKNPRVRRVVSIAATAPYLEKTADNPQGVERERFEQLWATVKADAPGWVAANIEPFFTPTTPRALMEWGANLLLATPLIVWLAGSHTVVDSDLRPDLRAIDVPALFLHGAQDVSVSVQFGRYAAELVRGSQLKIYDDGAHGVFVTHADALNADILAFMQNH